MGERQYGIALSPKIYSIMSDRLYTDRVGSVVREVCSNAWDAQKMKSIETGQPMEPFKVTLPTDLEPHFVVEDSGPGMPDEVAQDLYSTLGLSTKENTNDQIGAFGLGSKSPFAVTDTFTVENTYKGVTHNYLCFKAENGLPSLLKTGENNEGRPDGVKVIIPAAGHKYLEYKTALNRQLIVMEPKPILNNIEQFEFKNPNKVIETPEGFILANAHDFNLQARNVYARMGMVIYPIIDTAQGLIYGGLHTKIGASAALILEFNIGDLEPLPSREGLTYDEKTKNAIKAKYDAFQESYSAILKQTVSEQETPLAAWKKIQELKASVGVDLSNGGIEVGGMVINDRPIGDFPEFDHTYKDTVRKWGWDDNNNRIELEPEIVDRTLKVSQFVFHEYSSSDLGLTTKRENTPVNPTWRTIDAIEQDLIEVVIMDELEPKHRVSRMKSVLNNLRGRGWSNRIWMVHVDPRSSASKTEFNEFIDGFEKLHKGITAKFIWFSKVPRPPIVKRVRTDDDYIEGVTYKGRSYTYENRIRWSTVDNLMSPDDVDEEDDGYEEACEKAKADFLSRTFYVTANRNDLDIYDFTIKSIMGFCSDNDYNIFIVRKTGAPRIKELKELGLKEFTEFINEKLDGHEVSDDYKKYHSAKKIASMFPNWNRYSTKTHMLLLYEALKTNGEFIHPFIQSFVDYERLSSFDKMIAGCDEATVLIDRLRQRGLIHAFEGKFDWATFSEIDVGDEFSKLEDVFVQYYPVFELLIAKLDFHNGVNERLYQYVVDYNALRGKDVTPEQFEEETV